MQSHNMLYGFKLIPVFAQGDEKYGSPVLPGIIQQI